MDPFAGRPLPTWWADAGLGILVHWGPYSVPAWAPVGPDPLSVAETSGWDEALRRTPCAEWYWNALEVEGSAVAAHHGEAHHGSTYDDFAESFRAASASFVAGSWVDLFDRAGAGYLVLTAKHHDGFLLWPAWTANPRRGRAWQAEVDLVGEVAGACRRRGLRFGAYYSGGLDWTCSGLGAATLGELHAARPSDPAYAHYVQAHWLELVERYRPEVLWNDVNHPGGAAAVHQLFDRYYGTVPDGVVNDRFDLVGTAAGTTHSDFTTPEQHALVGVPRRPFEVCRALGTSFGWNRTESDDDLLTTELVAELLVDVRSRGGNLLLGIGPTAHGSIPRLQRQRLEGLAAWMAVARNAVIGARPWDLPALPASDGRVARATTGGGGSLYLTLCGEGAGGRIGITGLVLDARHEVRLLGHGEPLSARSSDRSLEVELPLGTPRPPVLRITPVPRLLG